MSNYVATVTARVQDHFARITCASMISPTGVYLPKPDIGPNEVVMIPDGMTLKADYDPRYELRIDGPDIFEKPGYTVNIFEINVLIAVKIDQRNPLKVKQTIDKVRKAFTPVITLADGSCMLQDTKYGLRINDFGQASKDLQLIQATIEAHYYHEVA